MTAPGPLVDLLSPGHLVDLTGDPVRVTFGWTGQLRGRATLLLQVEPAHVVSESLGHNNVSTTLNIYAHVLPDQREQAARSVDRIFAGG